MLFHAVHSYAKTMTAPYLGILHSSFKKAKFTAASNNLDEPHVIFEQKELDSKSTYYIVLFI